jgi:hypothetical protein
MKKNCPYGSHGDWLIPPHRTTFGHGGWPGPPHHSSAATSVAVEATMIAPALSNNAIITIVMILLIHITCIKKGTGLHQRHERFSTQHMQSLSRNVASL